MRKKNGRAASREAKRALEPFQIEFLLSGEYQGALTTNILLPHRARKLRVCQQGGVVQGAQEGSQRGFVGDGEVQALGRAVALQAVIQGGAVLDAAIMPLL